MSCCGQRRSALRQQSAPGQPGAQGQPGPVAAPGRGNPPLKAALLAFLARKAVSPGAGTGAGPRGQPAPKQMNGLYGSASTASASARAGPAPAASPRW